MTVSFPVVDIQSDDEERHRRNLAEGVNSLRDGKINSAVDFELDTGVVSTLVETPFCGSTSRVFLQPVDANAAADFASGTIFILEDVIVNGQFTISHTIFSGTRTFRCSMLS